ncbi:hypothetical protein EDD15DRAFT_2198399 [Pisolithus albus]|nr:hypothetical protein EDD15DRAFT_2198399 [Pisolithus albus]
MSTRDAADPERGGNNDVAAYAEVGYSSSGDEFATDAPHPEQGENGEEAVCEELGYSSSTNKSRKIWTGRKKAVVNLRISLTSTPQKDMNPMTMSKVMNDPQSSLEGCQVGEPSVAEGKKRESIQSEVADSNGQKKPSPKYPGKKKVKRLPHPQSSEHSAFKKLIRELGQQLLGLESPKELPRIIGEEEIAAWDPESGLCCTVDNFSVDLKGYVFAMEYLKRYKERNQGRRPRGPPALVKGAESYRWPKMGWGNCNANQESAVMVWPSPNILSEIIEDEKEGDEGDEEGTDRAIPNETCRWREPWGRDRRKLTFYFIAEKRINFRKLVRELFRLYKTHIWMASLRGPWAGGYKE